MPCAGTVAERFAGASAKLAKCEKHKKIRLTKFLARVGDHFQCMDVLRCQGGLGGLGQTLEIYRFGNVFEYIRP